MKQVEKSEEMSTTPKKSGQKDNTAAIPQQKSESMTQWENKLKQHRLAKEKEAKNMKQVEKSEETSTTPKKSGHWAKIQHRLQVTAALKHKPSPPTSPKNETGSVPRRASPRQTRTTHKNVKK